MRRMFQGLSVLMFFSADLVTRRALAEVSQPSCDEMAEAEELAEVFWNKSGRSVREFDRDATRATLAYTRCLASRVDGELAKMAEEQRGRWKRLRGLAKSYMAALEDVNLAQARLDYPPTQLTEEAKNSTAALAEQLVWNVFKVRAGKKLTGKPGSTFRTYEADARAQLSKPSAAPKATKRAIQAFDEMVVLVNGLSDKERWAVMKWAAERAAQYNP
jgi:hypothetical protein